MPATAATRVNYFDRQYIGLAELRDEQAYHVQLRRRHDLSHHSWGIVSGLGIVVGDDGVLAVQPGLAVDGYGRELLLADRQVFGRDVFDRYGTSRLDLWLEYALVLADDRLAPVECDGGDPSRRYRATEGASIVPTRGGARPDPRRPSGVSPSALEEPLLATPDDPRVRWPVYLGRIVMVTPASGPPTFELDVADRVYVGLNAESIDHPGNATRLELGRESPELDGRAIDGSEIQYSGHAGRYFAVFVPPVPSSSAQAAATSPPPLEPTLGVYRDGTQIRGSTEVHGNLVLDGASLQLADAGSGRPDTEGDPAIYRSGGELRIDMGDLAGGTRAVVFGLTNGGEFQPVLEITLPDAGSSDPTPVVTIRGDLRIEGRIAADDMRARTVTEEVAALLTGMVQAGIVAGGSSS